MLNGVTVELTPKMLLGTLRDNLIDGERISDLDLTECIKDVGLEDILRQLDEGLATVITPDDERLPMEMRFRVGLARALLKKPDVCAIEEPPSSGDLHVDARTLDSQRRLAQQETITLVLPRRLATLRACDRVVLLDAGRVVDEGTHAELLKRCELYRHLNYLQFNAARRSE
ncbi:MAG: ABC transporter ATP-binding protein [Planctomycetota bacterium]|nr:MAG: ABC transporter ATP-binding protein [Planctomycetota bacterium]